MMKYKVLFDGDMIQNIFETNQSEAYSYLSVPIVVWVLLAGVLPAVLLFFVKIEYPAKWYQGLLQRGLHAGLAGGIGDHRRSLLSGLCLGRAQQPDPEPGDHAGQLHVQHHQVSLQTLSGGAGTVPAHGDDAKRVAGKEKPTMMFLVVGRRRAARTSP